MADRSSGQSLLTIPQPQPNQNGGLVSFGPDGHRYIGMGDGGNAGDVGAGHAPQGNGQSLTTLLGKILRIEIPATGPYTVPAGLMDVLQVTLLVLVAAGATTVVLIRVPVRQVVALSAYGLLLAMLFLVFQAPDVAEADGKLDATAKCQKR